MAARRWHVDSAFLLPKAFYFFYFAAAASLSPYLTLHYRQAGLGEREIGLLLSVPPLVMLFAAPLWGGLADATRRHKTLLALAIGGVLGAVAGLRAARGLPALLGAVAIYALFNAPIIAYVDSAVLAMLGARKALYARQRLWGAVGWGVAAAGVGALTDRAGLDWSFRLYWPFMAVCLVLAWRFAIPQTAQRPPFWRGLRGLVANRRWVAFMVSVFIGGVGGSAAFNYLFLHLEDLGAARTLMGLALATASVGEVLMFSAAGALLQRIGARGLLLISWVASAVRLLGYSLMGQPWLVLPLQLLHGPAFSGGWTAGVSYVDALAPPGMGATAQALYGAVGSGLATACGSLLGGAIYERFGSPTLFRASALVVLAAASVFLGSERLLGRGARAASPRKA